MGERIEHQPLDCNSELESIKDERDDLEPQPTRARRLRARPRPDETRASAETRDGRSFDSFWRACANSVFVRSAKVRARYVHNGTLPSHCHSLEAAVPEDAPCAECREFHNDLILKLYGVTLNRIDDPSFDPIGYAIAAAAPRAEDIVRGRMTEAGGLAKPARAVEAAWITDALPDDRQRRLLALMLHYVQSNDRPEGDLAWPIERFSTRLLLDPDIVAGWVVSVPEVLMASGDRGAGWVTGHLLDPLGRRLTTDCAGGDPWMVLDRPIRRGRDDPSSPVEDAVIERDRALTVGMLVAGARALCRDGLEPIDALRAAAARLLDDDESERLLGRVDLLELAESIVEIRR